MRKPILITGAAAFLLSALSVCSTTGIVTAALILITACTVFYVAYKKNRQFLLAGLILAGITANIMLIVFYTVSPVEERAGQTLEATVLITGERIDHDGYSVLTGKLERLDNATVSRCNIRLTVADGTDIDMGDRVTALVKMKSVRQSKYKTMNYADNIFAAASVNEFLNVDYDADYLLSKIYSLKRYIRSTVQSYLPGEESGLIIAVMTGDNSGISDPTYSAVRSSGVSHMIVVSGMHLTIICEGILLIIRRILQNRFIIGAVTLLSVFFIMLVCGFTMSILRAGITYIIVTAGILVNRERDSLSALAATVIIVVFLFPFAFYSISFQLTLAATFGILVVSPLLTRAACAALHTGRRRIPSALVSVICVTLSANIMTLPVALFTFESISALSVVTNVLITYAVSAMLILSVIGVVIGGFGLLANPCFLVTGLLSKYSLAVINFIGSRSYATIKFNGIPAAMAVCAVFLLCHLIYVIRRLKRNM